MFQDRHFGEVPVGESCAVVFFCEADDPEQSFEILAQLDSSPADKHDPVSIRMGESVRGDLVLNSMGQGCSEKLNGARLTNEQLTVGRGPRGIRPQSDELGETTLNKRATALDQGVHNALTSGASCSTNHASFWRQGAQGNQCGVQTVQARVADIEKVVLEKTPS